MEGNKDKLFRILDDQLLTVTFDELTIEDERRADFDWQDVDLSSRLSRRVDAKIPILTTPMTTITEAEMAIAAAKEGGAGVIHHANTPEEQKRLVRRVKFHLNGIIEEPVTVRADDTIETTLESIGNQGYDFRTLPVVDEDGRFAGLMTNTHFELFHDSDKTMPIKDAMTPAEEIFTASAGTDVGEAFHVLRERKIKVLPLIDDEYRVAGLYVLPDVLRAVRGNPENYNLDASGRLRTCMSVSTYDGDAVDRVRESGKYLDVVVVDTSHGESRYSFSALEELKQARKTVRNLREEFAELDIMVGNVSYDEAARELAKEGPDAIRVGRGPSGICISREKLGGGTPQASAIYKCRTAVDTIDPEIQICADGGIRGPSDFVKALGLGASSIMVGGFVAATDEAAAPVMTRADGTQYKEYNGMGSAKEQRRSMAARNRYGSNNPHEALFVEGVEKEIPLQGPVSRKFRELVRGARIEMCTGAFPNIPALQEGVHFRRVSAAGYQESRASA